MDLWSWSQWIVLVYIWIEKETGKGKGAGENWSYHLMRLSYTRILYLIGITY